MERRLHRREFLVLSAQMAAAGRFVTLEQLRALLRAPSAARFSSERRRTLRAAMDEIIPADGRMPAVSSVGGLRYVEAVAGAYPEIGKTLDALLGLLERGSRETFSESFASTASERRIQLLSRLEKDPGSRTAFASFRNLAYEAYYTSPRVWKRIGYTFRSSRHPTATLEPFDPKLLARVRRMARLYREAD
jgi:hypothetical protein